jgi:hypothetical protein
VSGAEKESVGEQIDALAAAATSTERRLLRGGDWTKRVIAVDQASGDLIALIGRIEQLVIAMQDLTWKATPYGETEDGDVAAYILPKGAVHRLIGAAAGLGIFLSVRSFEAVARGGEATE